MLLAALLAATPLTALAEPAFGVPSAALQSEISDRSEGELRQFYRSRDNRPLWIAAAGTIDPAAYVLLDLIRTADLDGAIPRKLKPRDLDGALRRAEDERSARNLARAELQLSRSLIAYVKAVRQAQRAAMTYVSPDLAPVVPSGNAVLTAAAAAPVLRSYVAEMGWMHPLYAPLRKAAESSAYSSRRVLLRANLARLRALPAQPAARYVLVDAAGARLWMYENGRPVDSMKVVVGKADNQTPMLAGHIRHAILNPYWNIPVDLGRTKIARGVLERGLGYLRTNRYEVMSDWTDTARPIDPARVDWQAVADGRQEVRVRQLPGGSNFMGRVKFEFPNDLGIYLHDTPEKELMAKDSRQYSSGCVRLEDAQRLGRWLMRKPLPRRVSERELRVDLPQAVPVYITYLTAMPASGQITFQADPYGRDGPMLAGGDEVRRSR
jgi:murein L,D-transpeptidase YcbB/YkuD